MTNHNNPDVAAVISANLPRLRVLLAEADEQTAWVMRRLLANAGMDVQWAKTMTEAIDLTRSFGPQIALVDLELPDSDGVDLIRWLASMGHCGIVVVSGYVPELSNVLCLEVGADDFITKPASPRDLVARIRAVYRRTHSRRDEANPPSIEVAIGSAKVDFQHRRVTDAKGQAIDITSAELAVLQTLVKAHGKTVSRNRLSEDALRRPWRAEDRSIDQLVFNLRRKIMPDRDNNEIIRSIRGAGYQIPALA